jgi:tetratricopeptide (TPR) repeat protein
MPSVFISHSSKDKPFVRELADALRRDGEIQVWLDEREIAPGDNFVSRIKDGLDADFVLLVLSPDSVASNWVEQEWTDALAADKLLPVLYRDCKLPALVRTRKYFDLRTNHPDGFRAIRAYLLTQKPVVPERVNYLPVRPPLFVGREEELKQLCERLGEPGAVVHVQGLAGKGKTTLALEFAHRYQRDFDAVYWLPCQSSSLASIAAELTRLLGLKLEGDLPRVVSELKQYCAGKRCLLILDNVQDESPGDLIPGGAASVLVTTRHTNLKFLRMRQPVPLPVFTEEQCFDLFRRQLGADEVSKHKADCERLFQRVGYLPIAVSIAAALIKEDVRYTIPGMAQAVPEDVTALIREAIQALDPAPRQLLAAMSACAPEGFFLDLAAEIAEMDEQGSLAALQQLTSRSLADEIDRTDRRYRLHALVRETANGGGLAQRHAEAIQHRFEKWETNWSRCEQELPDLLFALEWAVNNPGAFRIGTLANDGYFLTYRVSRFAEGVEICESMRRIAEEYGNMPAVQGCLGNQATILQVWGHLEEAMALLQKQEAICLELDSKEGLQACYGNQAMIFRTQGHLGEALPLLRKQELICLELDNKNGLQACYGNQAVILLDRGQLDEAMALQEKKEEICRDLGNQDGLQRCYGNQAVILQIQGRLDEALALLKKQEAMCLDLGNKESLARCYGNCGLLEHARGNSEAAEAKLSAALDLFTQLGMPREREQAAADLAKARAASDS